MPQRIKVYSYSIYHSANSYIGIALAEKSLRGLPVDLERRPMAKWRSHSGISIWRSS
ncbi:hypothetical protein [Nostoc sp.]|uniref:hypothetical protein n=1 Tax=Nostoc sp. TaxID=1180 RepID=UPI002FFBA886